MGCVGSRVDVEADGRQYHLKKLIASGQIYSAEDIESGKHVAIKKIACHSAAEVQRTCYEVDFHRRLSKDLRPGHIHIMPILGVAEHQGPTSSQLFYSLIFPLCKVDFGSACHCPIQIENGKHSRKMLDEAAELCTMPYRAPELYTCETGTVVDTAVDIWSLGCVLYALCYFCSPYDEIHERGDSVALAVQSAKLNFNSQAPFSSSIKDLISQLIKTDSSERPSIRHILQNLQEI